MNKNANSGENDRNRPDAVVSQIQERAYYLWLEGGCGHGDHERHWLQAEKEVMETAKQEREQRSDVRNEKKTGKRINN